MVTKKTAKIEIAAIVVPTVPEPHYADKSIKVAYFPQLALGILAQAVADRLVNAGYHAEVEHGGGIKVRRVEGAAAWVHVGQPWSYTGTKRDIAFVVKSRPFDRARGRRYVATYDIINQSNDSWTFRFWVNVVGLIEAVEDELDGMESSERFRAQQKADADAAEIIASRFRASVEQLKLHPRVESVELAVHPSETPSFGITVRFDRENFGTGILAGEVLPYVERFPTAHLEVRYNQFELSGLSQAQMEAALFGPDPGAALEAFNRALEQALR